MASELEKQLKGLEKSRNKGVLTDEEYAQRRSALLSSTPAPSGGSKKSGILKFGMFGCLGILAGIGVLVVLVIVAISAALSGAGDDSPDSGGDVHVALAPNASAEISAAGNGSKKSKVTILQIVDGATPDNQFLAPAEGKKYFAMEVLIENTGSQEVGSLDWKMRDSADNELDRSFVSGVGDNLDVLYAGLTPGGKKQGWVVFEMDAANTPKWIRADPNPFLKNDLYFDAQ